MTLGVSVDDATALQSIDNLTISYDTDVLDVSTADLSLGDLLAGWNDGIVVYDTSAQSREQLTDFGTRPVWIDEGNRLLFFDEVAVYLLDRSTKRTTEILETAPHRIQSFGISSDLRLLYLSVTQAEADIWIAELQ